LEKGGWSVPRAPVIVLLLSNTLKMIVFHSASTVDDKHLSTQL